MAFELIPFENLADVFNAVHADPVPRGLNVADDVFIPKPEMEPELATYTYITFDKETALLFCDNIIVEDGVPGGWDYDPDTLEEYVRTLTYDSRRAIAASDGLIDYIRDTDTGLTLHELAKEMEKLKTELEKIVLEMESGRIDTALEVQDKLEQIIRIQGEMSELAQHIKTILGTKQTI